MMKRMVIVLMRIMTVVMIVMILTADRNEELQMCILKGWVSVWVHQKCPMPIFLFFVATSLVRCKSHWG